MFGLPVCGKRAYADTMKRPITLDDIAREVGVSKMTVSKALRGMRHVAPGTRKRIEEAAARLGYRSNPMVSSLMQQVRLRQVKGEAGTIAYIIRNRQSARIYDGKGNLAGAQERAAELGYKMDVFSLAEFGDARHMGKVLHARGIQGVVCGPVDELDRWDGFPWEKFSCVAAGLGHARLPVPLVRRNVSQGVRLAHRKLVEAGLERIAVLFTHRKDSELDLIAEGAIHMMIRYGSGDYDLIHPMDSPANTRRWIKRTRPDVIVLHYPPNLEILEEAGYGLDGPIPVVTLKLRGPRDPLAGIDHRPFEVGRATIDYLNQELQLNRTGLQENPPTIMIECAWVETPAFRRHLNRKMTR